MTQAPQRTDGPNRPDPADPVPPPRTAAATRLHTPQRPRQKGDRVERRIEHHRERTVDREQTRTGGGGDPPQPQAAQEQQHAEARHQLQHNVHQQHTAGQRLQQHERQEERRRLHLTGERLAESFVVVPERHVAVQPRVDRTLAERLHRPADVGVDGPRAVDDALGGAAESGEVQHRVGTCEPEDEDRVRDDHHRDDGERGEQRRTSQPGRPHRCTRSSVGNSSAVCTGGNTGG